MLITILLMIGVLPFSAFAAPDERWVIYIDNPADHNRHERVQYLGAPGHPQTPYYYSSTNDFSGKVRPFYVMQGDSGDLSVQHTRRSNWDEMQASPWPMMIGGTIHYNYGNNPWGTNPTQTTTVSLSEAQEAYRITMNYGYPFSDIGLKAPYNLTPSQAQNATNVAVQRLMGLLGGTEYSNYLTPCNEDMDAAVRVGNYEWFLEQKARAFLRTKNVETRLSLNPINAQMLPNGGMYERNVTVWVHTDGIS